MTTTSDTARPHDLISLNRMIYAFCGGIILYLLLELLLDISRQLVIARIGHVRFAFWYIFSPQVSNLCFVLAMLSVAVAYHFKVMVFRWDSEPGSHGVSWMKAVPLGLLGGAVALILASPTFWFGWGHRRTESIQFLIGDALSPLRVLKLLLFVFALAVSSEVVFRGIVFRTFARYASISAAVLANCLLFAFLYPVLGFGAAVVLGVTSSILYYKTRSILAPIFANALFTVGGGGIVLYHRLM